jgi:hypothetical protein
MTRRRLRSGGSLSTAGARSVHGSDETALVSDDDVDETVPDFGARRVVRVDAHQKLFVLGPREDAELAELSGESEVLLFYPRQFLTREIIGSVDPAADLGVDALLELLAELLLVNADRVGDYPRRRFIPRL